MNHLNVKVGSFSATCNSLSRAVVFFTLLGISALSAAQADVATPESIGFAFTEQAVSAPQGLEVQAIDELSGQVIPDAQVQISSFGQTALKVVHVRREGYSGISVYGVRGGVLKAMLKRDSALGTIAVSSGELRGYLPFLSGHVDGGIILRTLGVSDLLSLNVDSLLSPLKDEIRALGRRKIPSNIVFPKQNVGPFVKLDKPVFRLPMSSGRFTGLVGAQAAIEVSELMGLPSDPDPVDFANLLKLRKIGFTERMNPSESFTRDIPLTHELEPNLFVKLQNLPPQSNVFALSLIDMNDDRQQLTVADVKGMRYGTAETTASVNMNLMAPTLLPAGSVSYVIGAAISQKGKLISAAILNATQKRVEVKSLIPAPRIGVAPKDGMDVQALDSSSVSALMLQEKLDTKGARSHRVFVLPEAGKTHIDFQTAFPGFVLDQIGLTQMEFSGFDPRSIDGVTIVKQLKRFTYSISE